MDLGVRRNGKAVSESINTGECLGPAPCQEWGEDIELERDCV